MHYFIIRIWQQFISFRFFLVVACERESTFDFVSAQFLVMSEGKKKKYLQKCKLNYLTEFPCLKNEEQNITSIAPLLKNFEKSKEKGNK